MRIIVSLLPPFALAGFNGLPARVHKKEQRKDKMENVDLQTPFLENLPEVLEMAATVASIGSKKPLIQKYRSVQSLQLTDVQAKLLRAITQDVIAEADLRAIVGAFKDLKTIEHLIDGKPTEIKGLVAYLVALEKEDVERETPFEFEEAEVVE